MKIKKSIRIKFFILFLISLILGCSSKNNNIDFDLSNLPRPKNNNLDSKEKKEVIKPQDKSFISDLIPLKEKEEILSKFEFGKEDPFSERGVIEDKIFSDLKLTGFLNSQSKQYVFVIYQNKHGTITENSIGGINTNLLPNGAKVLNIDSSAKKLIINFENKDYLFEL